MKKFLSVLLSLMLAVSLSVVVVSVSAKAKTDRDHGDKNTSYTAGNAVDVYNDYAANQIGGDYACKNAVNLFEGTYKASWYSPNSSLKIHDDGTATCYPSQATGHVLKNYKYGYGTFLMSFKITTNDSIPNLSDLLNTAAGVDAISTFWGIEFCNNVGITSNFENLSVPWTVYGGYPYVISFDGETCADIDANVVGQDGLATLPDGTLVSDAVAENPEGEYGRKYQTGLSLRRYKYAGSHNYYRWSATNPTNANYINSISQDSPSLVPDLYREVRMEDIWDGNEHSLLTQFQPLSIDNGDGIDAMMVDVWMSGLTACEGDETKVANGKTFTHVLRVYDDMPFEDVDNEGTVVDKRAQDGYVVLWTHNNYDYASQGSSWNYYIDISEFCLLDAGSYEDYDVSKFPQLTGVGLLGGTYTYDGQPHTYQFNGLTDDMIVTYYDEEGNILNINELPSYTDAGTYSIKAKISKSGYKPAEVEATIVIEKNKATFTTATKSRQSAIFDGKPHDVVFGVEDNDGNALDFLNETVTFSPSKSFTDAGIYTVILTIPESKNYLGDTKKVTYTVSSSGSGEDELEFSQDQINAMEWVGDGVSDTFTAKYDGKEHAMWLTNIPEGATVVYTNNVNVNAGTYSVTAKVMKEGYKTETLSAEMKIEKATVTITAAAVQEYYFCNAPISAIGSADNGAVVVYDQLVTAVGEYTVVISVPETANYAAASVTVTVKVVNA